MSVLYAVLNPIVKTLLKSPLHGLMSGNTMLLSYTGRKSGRHYTMPISYMVDGNTYCGFAARQSIWWRNMTPDSMVNLYVAGSAISARVNIEQENLTKIADGLANFLSAVPRDAGPAGVRLNADGTPIPEDIEKAARKVVAVYFEPDPM